MDWWWTYSFSWRPLIISHLSNKCFQQYHTKGCHYSAAVAFFRFVGTFNVMQNVSKVDRNESHQFFIAVYQGKTDLSGEGLEHKGNLVHDKWTLLLACGSVPQLHLNKSHCTPRPVQFVIVPEHFGVPRSDWSQVSRMWSSVQPIVLHEMIRMLV